MTHIEYDCRSGNCRNDQRNERVCQAQCANHELYETGRSYLNRNHHNGKNERVSTITNLELINSQTVCSHCREEYGQNRRTSCDNQAVPITTQQIPLRRLCCDILHVFNKVAARNQRYRRLQDGIMTTASIYNHQVQRH